MGCVVRDCAGSRFSLKVCQRKAAEHSEPLEATRRVLSGRSIDREAALSEVLAGGWVLCGEVAK